MKKQDKKEWINIITIASITAFANLGAYDAYSRFLTHTSSMVISGAYAGLVGGLLAVIFERLKE